jgi:hypothetical protein
VSCTLLLNSFGPDPSRLRLRPSRSSCPLGTRSVRGARTIHPCPPGRPDDVLGVP